MTFLKSPQESSEITTEYLSTGYYLITMDPVKDLPLELMQASAGREVLDRVPGKYTLYGPVR